MDPTDEQYSKFGSAVAGIMDVYTSFPGVDPERILYMIQMAADVYEIEFKQVRA